MPHYLFSCFTIELFLSITQVREVLLELLKDPAFRAFLLQAGLDDALNDMLEIDVKIEHTEVQYTHLLPN